MVEGQDSTTGHFLLHTIAGRCTDQGSLSRSRRGQEWRPSPIDTSRCHTLEGYSLLVHILDTARRSQSGSYPRKLPDIKPRKPDPIAHAKVLDERLCSPSSLSTPHPSIYPWLILALFLPVPTLSLFPVRRSCASSTILNTSNPNWGKLRHISLNSFSASCLSTWLLVAQNCATGLRMSFSSSVVCPYT